MMPVNIGFDPATSFNAPCPAPKGGGALTAGILSARANGSLSRQAATGPASFHHMLRDAAAATDEAPAHTAPEYGEDAVKKTDRGTAGDHSRARPTRRQDLTAGGGKSGAAAEAPSHSTPAHGGDALRATGSDAAGDDRRGAANGTEGQPVWALLAQIIQDLTAAADTNVAAVEGQDAAAASDSEAGDAADDLTALVDFLKQLQESPAAGTAENAMALDRLRQMLEQWQASANENQPAGLPGRLLDLIKKVQDALPGIARERWAAASADQGGAAEKGSPETANPAGARPIPAAGSQPDGLPAGGGRVALRDPKGTQVAAGQTDAGMRGDEISDRHRHAADERGIGAGRVMPAPPLAASPSAESLRSTDPPSKPQASEAGFVLSKNFEPASDTQSEVSDDSRPPAEKAAAGLALSTTDKVAEEGGSPSLRFEAALRDVHSFAVPDGSPDKPGESAAAVKGRDTAAAPGKTDVFDQIVQRAAVHVKNDQGEIRIDLKPEYLGHVRLQIVTDNQQVTVRILTELPMVRDMIENNIHQLKSDLQQQGLQVERVEVAVADDPRQHSGRQARTGAGPKGRAGNDAAPAAAEISTELRPEAAYRWGLGGQTTINMFA